MCFTLLTFWWNSGEFRPGNHQSLELESQQIGREKGPHVIMFHCQVGIYIVVSCRFSICAVELPASCAGAAVRAPASHNDEIRDTRGGATRRDETRRFQYTRSARGRVQGER